MCGSSVSDRGRATISPSVQRAANGDGGALQTGRAGGIDRRPDVGLDRIADGGVGRNRIGDGGAGRDGVGDGGAGRDRVIGRGRGVDGDAGGIDDDESRHGVFPNAIGAKFCRGWADTTINDDAGIVLNHKEFIFKFEIHKSRFSIYCRSVLSPEAGSGRMFRVT